jgi:flagellar biosynthesis/type III secretory pathway protein FliH
VTRIVRADRRGPALIPAALADAGERARAIIAHAEAQADATRAQALETARTQARAELAAEHLALAHAHASELDAQQRQAIELATAIARTLVGDELTSRPERIAAIAAPLLSRVRRARQVALRAHPDDAATLELALADLRARCGVLGSLHVEADAGIARGGCVVSSDAGTLDARVETRIDALARALEAKLR